MCLLGSYNYASSGAARERNKYPPAKLGALGSEPLKVAVGVASIPLSPCAPTLRITSRARQWNFAKTVSLSFSCFLHHLVFALISPILKFPFVCLVPHDSKLSSMGNCRKRQTATATPAEPGELLFWFRVEHLCSADNNGPASARFILYLACRMHIFAPTPSPHYQP
jgi:hypothetical protein